MKDLKICVGDLCKFNGKRWRCFAISDSGLVTLKNIKEGERPASLVVARKDIDKITLIIGIIKK